MKLEHLRWMTVAYDDWFVPELLPDVEATLAEFTDWELEVIIAAEAYYAANFLCRN